MKKLLLLVIATSFSLSLAITDEEKAHKLKQKKQAKAHRLAEKKLEKMTDKMAKIMNKCAKHAKASHDTDIQGDRGTDYIDCILEYNPEGVVVDRAFFYSSIEPNHFIKYAFRRAQDHNEHINSDLKTITDFNRRAVKNLKEILYEISKITNI